MTSEIRANKQTNRAGLGTVTYADTGIIVSGIVTCTELSGLTALNIAGVGTASTLDINGDIDVDGHTNLDNVSIAGVVTATTFVGALTGEASQVTIGNGANNKIVTATGTNTLGCDANFSFDGNVMQLGQSGAGGALYIHGDTINNPGGRDAKVWIEDPSSNDWALHINKPSHNYGIQMSMADGASHAFYILGGGGERFRITAAGEVIVREKITHHNDGDTQIKFPAADTISFETAGSERLRITSDGEVGISPGGVTPTAGDLQTGDSQNKPLIHVKGSGVSATGGEYNLLGRFEAGGDADYTGAMVVLNHSNDRGLALIGGRATSNNAFAALKMIDNVGRLTNIMTATGYSGQGVGDIRFFTGNSTTTTERLHITGDGNIGIGNDNPTVKLQITDTSATILRTEATANDGDALIQAKGKDSSGNDRMIQMRTDAGADQYRIISSDTSYNLALCTGNAPRVLIAGNSAATSIGGANTFNAMLTVQGDISGGLLALKAAENTNRFNVSGMDGNDVEVNLYDKNGGQRGILVGGETEFAIKAPNSSAPLKFYTNDGSSMAARVTISKHGQLLHGNPSEDQGWAVFWRAAGGGADAGTAGQDGAGDQGVNIRSDMGPTHVDLTGTDNYTLKLANQAYSGSGVADPYGTISKILFNTVTYNGWNSYGGIALQSVGVSAGRGEMVFMLNNGTSSMNEKMRIKSTYIQTANNTGMEIYGGDINHPNDSVFFVRKTSNADWAIKCDASHSNSSDYGMFSRVDNSASYAIGVNDTSTWRFRVSGGGQIYATNTSVASISDQRLKENIVDANSQWDDIKALRFRNYKWKSDSGRADGKTYLGLIAQEVEPISPGLVDIDAQTKEDIENNVPDPEYKNVKYSIVWMKAVKALQEAQARIEQLEARIEQLEAKVSALEG